MRPKTFLWTTFLSLVAAILLSSTFFGILLYRHLYTADLQALKLDLQKEARLLADMAASSPDLLQQPQKIARLVHTQDRITVLAVDGKVLADNWAERMGKEAIENHANRPEFQGALHDAPVYQERLSHTLGIRMLYFAVPVKFAGQTVLVLRLSFALTTFHNQMENVRTMLYGIALLNILLSLPFAFLLSRGLLRPVQKLRASSKSISEGDLSRRAPLEGSTEFRELAADFNRMADDLQQKIESLRQDRAQIETLLARMVEGVVALDPSGRAVFANAAFASMNDTTVERIVDRHYMDFARNSQLMDRISEQLSRPCETAGGRAAAEIKMFGRTGGEKQYAMEVSLIHDDRARLLLILLVFHDITRIKQVEQMRKDLVANISHELRTPLTAARGSIEILQDSPAEAGHPETSRFLGIVDKQLQNMQNLVDDMLRLATVEDVARVPLRRENTAVRALAEEAAALVRPLAERKKQNLSVEVLQEPLWISIDHAQVCDALVNILDNAVKYTQEKGSIELRVTREKNSIVFLVADNGPGIAADQLPRIFERFYRVDKSRSRELGGTGLGLSIARHAVENHGGAITVQSLPGHGTTFRIVLPDSLVLPPQL